MVLLVPGFMSGAAGVAHGSPSPVGTPPHPHPDPAQATGGCSPGAHWSHVSVSFLSCCFPRPSTGMNRGVPWALGAAVRAGACPPPGPLIPTSRPRWPREPGGDARKATTKGHIKTLIFLNHLFQTKGVINFKRTIEYRNVFFPFVFLPF